MGTKQIWIGLAALLAIPAARGEAPDAVMNPQSGYIETASIQWNGSDGDVLHTIDRGSLPPIVTTVSGDAADEAGARIAATSNGDCWVAWWGEDTHVVRLRHRAYGSSSWSAIRTASETSEDARRPVLALHDDKPWMAYEVNGTSTVSIRVGTIHDEPDPINPVTVGVTTFSGAVDPQVHSVSGHLWVDWVVSADAVAWTEYDTGTQTWAQPEMEEVEGGDFKDARGRIEQRVAS